MRVREGEIKWGTPGKVQSPSSKNPSLQPREEYSWRRERSKGRCFLACGAGGGSSGLKIMCRVDYDGGTLRNFGCDLPKLRMLCDWMSTPVVLVQISLLHIECPVGPLKNKLAIQVAGNLKLYQLQLHRNGEQLSRDHTGMGKSSLLTLHCVKVPPSVCTCFHPIIVLVINCTFGSHGLLK